MFEELKNESFSDRELAVLKFWEENKIFDQSIESRRQNPPFSFYDGPPFATGLPHYGHLLAGTIKDVIPRYKTMKGFCVERRFGWDCHGLPIENEIEKSFNLSGARAIDDFGIAKFNEECRKIVLRYTSEWKSVVTRMGRWVDFNQTYRTMDLSFMESVFWVFKKLYDLGLVYEGYKVMPFSAKLGTPLSNFEAGENYKDVDDPSLIVAMPLKEDPETALLIWTTTPWTLVSNLAILAGPEIDYVKVREKKSGKFFILGELRLAFCFKDPEEYEILERFKGKALEGKKYIPPFNYFYKDYENNSFRVIMEPQVTLDDGTGLVHAAPAFGELDFYACEKAGIGLVCPVDNNGQFLKDIPEYEGLFVKEADKDIAKRLKADGRLFHQATIHHRYPFCWRSDTPLIYKVVTTWFVAVEKIKDKLLKANDKIHWTPAHIKQGRFGKWLEGARDWAISRNRYWGTPIPIWRSEDGSIEVIGSIQELEKLTGEKINDLHRHFIDDLTFEKNGKVYKRIPEVFDCWFESGSMPYAQIHYPFENKDKFEGQFPADFIAEGLDQTRGWFYTLTILAAAIFDKPAFKNVVVNGIILAEDGAKMSKRLRNYPDPMEVVRKYGADAVRLYMMHSQAVKGDDLCFKESGVELVLRQILIPFWNAYSFFVTYAKIYNWKPSKEALSKKPDSSLDRWILSRLNKLIHEVELGMNDYDLSRAVEPFVGFVEDLTNWYIRRSRRRFWEEEDTEDRRSAFSTLYQVLLELSKLSAPFIPFLSESIYRNLKTQDMPSSVHLCQFPAYHEKTRDVELEEAMAAIQKAVSLGHALRKEVKLKVRQPLLKATLISKDEETLKRLEKNKHLIEEELNVKKVEFAKDESAFVKLFAKPNFPRLGKRLGSKMNKVKAAMEAFSSKELEDILSQDKLFVLNIEGEEIEFSKEDIEVRREVKEGLVATTESDMTLALDTELTEELIMEALAREIVNKVNTMRRDQNFNVTDRIHLSMKASDKVKKSFELHKDYIKGEVLAREVAFDEDLKGITWDLNGESVDMVISKVN